MFFTSFFKTHNSSINNICALPAYLHAFIARSLKRGVGTILSTSLSRASLTLETALVFPFFLFALLSVISFLSILGLQTSLQIRLEETARKLNSLSYISLDMKDSTFSEKALISAQIKQFFYSEGIEALCEQNHVINGYQGIYFHNTNIDTTNHTIDLIITYTVEIPFIPNRLATFHFMQNTTFRLFCGTDIFDTEEDSFSTVYLTPQGTVYHTHKYCTYLRKYTDIILESSLASYEQQTGKKFYPCSYCRKYYDTTIDSTIYISENGETYHYTTSCYHLNLIIYAWNKTDIPDTYSPCQRCASD